MTERIAFSLALDLLFNGQDMDYCERPISLSVFETMAMFQDLKERSQIGVIGPGGGRLLKTLLERGHIVDAYEGRDECTNHIRKHFGDIGSLKILPVSHLNEPIRRSKMSYSALFCMDDLRAFRERQEWTAEVQSIIKPGGYFVYSQVSNKLPKKRNTLSKYFEHVGNYNVSEETAQMIRDSYFSLDEWEPQHDEKKMAMKTLDMIEVASNLRRSIRSGVEIRYMVWRRNKT
ncbi:methyltransferase domain-containing protein [Kordiimonas pumila]|uniref:Methyltransferase type 11 domain-containing protein n=1 Tax=Kordiimonas pumila TaxID=2161677 RepID=A0ABV7D1S6_9PROT|nr:hypothetical protein [Kordiimonas pumila]